MTSDNSLAVSNSEIRTFKECRRRWYFTYYRRWGVRPEEESPTSEAKLGTRIHTALEYYYGQDIHPLKVINFIYTQIKQNHFNTSPSVLSGIDKEHDLAIAMVSGYMEWIMETGADEGLEVIAPEQVIRLPSGVPEVDLMAKIDLRVRRQHDGARFFIDHKTTVSFNYLSSVLHLDEQMRFYAMLDHYEAVLQGDDRPRTDGGLYNMLRRVKRTASAKPPFYQRTEVHYNIHDLRSMWIRTTAVVREIVDVRGKLDTGHDHRYVVYPTPTRDCTWKCPFFQLCPLTDDGSHWQEMADVLYVPTDPYAYYSPLLIDIEES